MKCHLLPPFKWPESLVNLKKAFAEHTHGDGHSPKKDGESID